MRSNISSVAGWFVPARGTCSSRLWSPSCSIRHTGMPACASASARHSPTGPAPPTTTRSSVLSGSAFRHHVLDGSRPALVGQIEHDADRVLVLCLVVGVRRCRSAFQIGAAGVDYLLLGLVEIVDPHAEVIEAELLVVALPLEQRHVDGAIRHVEAAARGPGALHVEGVFEKLRRLLRIVDDDGDVAQLGHGALLNSFLAAVANASGPA